MGLAIGGVANLANPPSRSVWYCRENKLLVNCSALLSLPIVCSGGPGQGCHHDRQKFWNGSPPLATIAAEPASSAADCVGGCRIWVVEECFGGSRVVPRRICRPSSFVKLFSVFRISQEIYCLFVWP